MPSKLKSETARRNGAKSHGPVTDEGKRTASRNAIKHGIHSTQVVLQHEDADLYHRLLNAYLDEWQPATPTEEDLVMDLANTRWRLQRIQQLVSATIEREIVDLKEHVGRQHMSMDPAAICVRAHERNHVQKGSLEMFERCEGRLHRAYHRTLKTLRSLQAGRLARQPAAAPIEETQNNRNEPTTAERPCCPCVGGVRPPAGPPPQPPAGPEPRQSELTPESAPVPEEPALP